MKTSLVERSVSCCLAATLSRALVAAACVVIAACGGSADAPPPPEPGPPATGTPPTITQQPANVSVTAGQAASFTVAATGTAPLAYQWQRDGVAIAGATAANYALAGDRGRRQRRDLPRRRQQCRRQRHQQQRDADGDRERTGADDFAAARQCSASPPERKRRSRSAARAARHARHQVAAQPDGCAGLRRHRRRDSRDLQLRPCSATAARSSALSSTAAARARHRAASRR